MARNSILFNIFNNIDKMSVGVTKISKIAVTTRINDQQHESEDFFIKGIFKMKHCSEFAR